MCVFDNDVQDRVKELTELYIIVKEIVLYSEEIDPENRADISVINELRNAFDHLMRVYAAYFEIQHDYEFLFSWDFIPGDDNDKLKMYLKNRLDIVWAGNAKISKSDDGKTIRIFNAEHSSEIEINKKKEKATLRINNARTNDLKVKKENGKLNIYDYDSKYVELNLNKALAHVYRAGYDTLDRTTLFLRKYIADGMEIFSLETINSVFPEYFKDIKPEIEELTDVIVKRRIEKDVGDQNFENFQKYATLMKTVYGYYKDVLKKKSALIEFENKLKKEKNEAEDRLEKKEKRKLIRTIIAGISVVIVSTIILYFGRSLISIFTRSP